MFSWARGAIIACFLTVVSLPTIAQADEWQFEATFYLYTAETTSGLRGNDVILGFGDALENIDVAFMGTFSATNDQWTFLADYMLVDLSFSGPSPNTAFSAEDLSVRTQVLTGLGLYNLYDDQRTRIDLGAGLRWFDTDTKLTLRAGGSPEQTQRENDNWIDPVVAARVRYDLNTRWSGTALVDFGSFIEDRQTWQLLVTANYAFRENWVARFGYRYLRVENDEDDQNYLFEQSGPIFGIAYRF